MDIRPTHLNSKWGSGVNPHPVRQAAAVYLPNSPHTAPVCDYMFRYSDDCVTELFAVSLRGCDLLVFAAGKSEKITCGWFSWSVFQGVC